MECYILAVSMDIQHVYENLKHGAHRVTLAKNSCGMTLCWCVVSESLNVNNNSSILHFKTPLAYYIKCTLKNLETTVGHELL